MAESTTSCLVCFVSLPENREKDPSPRMHCFTVLILPRDASKIPPLLLCQPVQLPFLIPLPIPNISILPHSTWESQRSVSPIPWTWKSGPSVRHYLSGKTNLGGGQKQSFLIRESPVCTSPPHANSFPPQSLLTFNHLCSTFMFLSYLYSSHVIIYSIAFFRSSHFLT